MFQFHLYGHQKEACNGSPSRNGFQGQCKSQRDGIRRRARSEPLPLAHPSSSPIIMHLRVTKSPNGVTPWGWISFKVGETPLGAQEGIWGVNIGIPRVSGGNASQGRLPGRHPDPEPRGPSRGPRHLQGPLSGFCSAHRITKQRPWGENIGFDLNTE